MEERMKEIEEEKDLDIDRLSSLHPDLILHIFGFLDTKSAVKASLSLKKWVNFWTLLPKLELVDDFKGQSSFDLFVRKVLSLRDNSVELKKFIYRGRWWSKMNLVSESIGSHEVQDSTKNDGILKQWASLHSVESLSLHSVRFFHPLLLTQVVNLDLQIVKFATPENFSGLPNLRELTLVECYFSNDKVGSVIVAAPLLSKLIISYCFYSYRDAKLLLSTPSLSFLEIAGTDNIPLLQADGLIHLDTVNLAFVPHSLYTERERQPMPNLFRQPKRAHKKLVCMLKYFDHVKSATLSSDIFELLSLFPKLLVMEPPPFCNLNSLNIVQHRCCKTCAVTIPRPLLEYLFGCLNAHIVISLSMCYCSKCNKSP